MVIFPISQDIPIWLVVWNMNFIFSIGNVIIPTDELVLFRGVGIPPTSHDISIYIYIPFVYIYMIYYNHHNIYIYSIYKYVYIYIYKNIIYIWIYPNHITTILYIPYISHLNPIHPMGQVLHPRRYKVAFDGCCRFLWKGRPTDRYRHKLDHVPYTSNMNGNG